MQFVIAAAVGQKEPMSDNQPRTSLQVAYTYTVLYVGDWQSSGRPATIAKPIISAYTCTKLHYYTVAQ